MPKATLSPLVISFVEATINHQVTRLNNMVVDKAERMEEENPSFTKAEIGINDKVDKLVQALEDSLNSHPTNLQDLLSSPTTGAMSITQAAGIQRGMLGEATSFFQETETLQNVTSSSNLYAISLFDSKPGVTDIKVLMQKLEEFDVTRTNAEIDSISEKYMPKTDWGTKHHIKRDVFSNNASEKLVQFKIEVKQSLTFLTQMQSLTAGNAEISKVDTNFTPSIDIQARLDTVDATLNNIESSLVLAMKSALTSEDQTVENIDILVDLAKTGLTKLDAQRSTLQDKAAEAFIKQINNVDVAPINDAVSFTEASKAKDDLKEALPNKNHISGLPPKLQDKVKKAIDKKTVAIKQALTTNSQKNKDALITEVADTSTASVDNASTIKAIEANTAALIEELRGTNLENIDPDLKDEVTEAIEVKVKAVQAICATKVAGFKAEQAAVIQAVNDIEVPTFKSEGTIKDAEAASDKLIESIVEPTNIEDYDSELATKIKEAISAKKEAITTACVTRVNEFKAEQTAVIQAVNDIKTPSIKNAGTIQEAKAETRLLLAQVEKLSNTDNFDTDLAIKLEAAVANITNNIEQAATKRVDAIEAKDKFIASVTATAMPTTKIDTAPDIDAVQKEKETLITQLTNGAKGLDADFQVEINEAIKATTKRIDTASTTREAAISAKNEFKNKVDAIVTTSIDDAKNPEEVQAAQVTLIADLSKGLEEITDRDFKAGVELAIGEQTTKITQKCEAKVEAIVTAAIKAEASIDFSVINKISTANETAKESIGKLDELKKQLPEGPYQALAEKIEAAIEAIETNLNERVATFTAAQQAVLKQVSDVDATTIRNNAQTIDQAGMEQENLLAKLPSSAQYAKLEESLKPDALEAGFVKIRAIRQAYTAKVNDIVIEKVTAATEIKFADIKDISNANKTANESIGKLNELNTQLPEGRLADEINAAIQQVKTNLNDRLETFKAIKQQVLAEVEAVSTQDLDSATTIEVTEEKTAAIVLELGKIDLSKVDPKFKDEVKQVVDAKIEAVQAICDTKVTGFRAEQAAVIAQVKGTTDLSSITTAPTIKGAKAAKDALLAQIEKLSSTVGFAPELAKELDAAVANITNNIDQAATDRKAEIVAKNDFVAKAIVTPTIDNAKDSTEVEVEEAKLITQLNKEVEGLAQNFQEDVAPIVASKIGEIKQASTVRKTEIVAKNDFVAKAIVTPTIDNAKDSTEVEVEEAKLITQLNKEVEGLAQNFQEVVAPIVASKMGGIKQASTDRKAEIVAKNEFKNKVDAIVTTSIDDTKNPEQVQTAQVALIAELSAGLEKITDLGFKAEVELAIDKQTTKITQKCEAKVEVIVTEAIEAETSIDFSVINEISTANDTASTSIQKLDKLKMQLPEGPSQALAEKIEAAIQAIETNLNERVATFTKAQETVIAQVNGVDDLSAVTKALTIEEAETQQKALIKSLPSVDAIKTLEISLKPAALEARTQKVDAIETACVERVNEFKAEQKAVIQAVNDIKTPSIETAGTINDAEAAKDVLLAQVKEMSSTKNFAPELAIELTAAVETQTAAITAACETKVAKIEAVLQTVLAEINDIDVSSIASKDTVEEVASTSVELNTALDKIVLKEVDPDLREQVKLAATAKAAEINQAAEKQTAKITFENDKDVDLKVEGESIDDIKIDYTKKNQKFDALKKEAGKAFGKPLPKAITKTIDLKEKQLKTSRNKKVAAVVTSVIQKIKLKDAPTTSEEVKRNKDADIKELKELKENIPEEIPYPTRGDILKTIDTAVTEIEEKANLKLQKFSELKAKCETLVEAIKQNDFNVTGDTLGKIEQSHTQLSQQLVDLKDIATSAFGETIPEKIETLIEAKGQELTTSREASMVAVIENVNVEITGAEPEDVKKSDDTLSGKLSDLNKAVRAAYGKDMPKAVTTALKAKGEKLANSRKNCITKVVKEKIQTINNAMDVTNSTTKADVKSTEESSLAALKQLKTDLPQNSSPQLQNEIDTLITAAKLEINDKSKSKLQAFDRVKNKVDQIVSSAKDENSNKKK